jgi:hypothetical protein
VNYVEPHEEHLRAERRREFEERMDALRRQRERPFEEKMADLRRRLGIGRQGRYTQEED